MESATPEGMNYFTISQDGVTHFSPEYTEFTNIEQWEREFGHFYAIKRIPFFSNFRKLKYFSMWRNIVSSSKLKQASKRLTQQLFILDEVLRDALVETKDLCINLQQ